MRNWWLRPPSQVRLVSKPHLAREENVRKRSCARCRLDTLPTSQSGGYARIRVSQVRQEVWRTSELAIPGPYARDPTRVLPDEGGAWMPLGRPAW